jgi:hypothetical protein
MLYIPSSILTPSSPMAPHNKQKTQSPPDSETIKARRAANSRSAYDELRHSVTHIGTDKIAPDLSPIFVVSHTPFSRRFPNFAKHDGKHQPSPYLDHSHKMDPIGLSFGAVSLVFQLFAGCVKGTSPSVMCVNPYLPCCSPTRSFLKPIAWTKSTAHISFDSRPRSFGFWIGRLLQVFRSATKPGLSARSTALSSSIPWTSNTVC